jgi:hypothetical protein
MLFIGVTFCLRLMFVFLLLDHGQFLSSEIFTLLAHAALGFEM